MEQTGQNDISITYALAVIALFIAAIIFGGGCGHNVGTAFSGKAVNIGYDPEFNKFGVQYYDGIIVTGVTRENATTEMEFADTLKNAEKGETSSSLKYKQTIGSQVSGYTVEAIEAGAKPNDIIK